MHSGRFRGMIWVELASLDDLMLQKDMGTLVAVDPAANEELLMRVRVKSFAFFYSRTTTRSATQRS